MSFCSLLFADHVFVPQDQTNLVGLGVHMDYLKLMMEHKKKPLNIIQVCKIGMRTVEQLKVLHDKLYLHHDVKPNNILSNYTK